jgi:hypothetical protein
MPATYEPIATTTLGSSGGITFSSIPSTYTDLRLIICGVGPVNNYTYIRLNGATSNSYSWTEIRGDGSTATSTRQSNQASFPMGYVINTNPILSQIDLFSYASTSVNKTILVQSSADNNGSGTVFSCVGLFRSTSAVTSISTVATTWPAGTTATLYGILKA